MEFGNEYISKVTIPSHAVQHRTNNSWSLNDMPSAVF